MDHSKESKEDKNLKQTKQLKNIATAEASTENIMAKKIPLSMCVSFKI